MNNYVRRHRNFDNIDKYLQICEDKRIELGIASSNLSIEVGRNRNFWQLSLDRNCITVTDLKKITTALKLRFDILINDKAK